MKRVLVVLPLLALLLGLALYLSRRPQAQPAPPSPPTAETPAARPHDHDEPKAPSLPPTTGADATCSIRFVVTMRGKPVPMADLSVGQVPGGKVARFKAEPDGTQLLKGMPPGEYSVAVTHEDAMAFGTTVVLTPGQTVTVTADLKVGGRILGTVRNRAGQPVPGTRVLLLHAATKIPTGQEVAVSGNDGTYTVRAIPPGDYTVRYRHVEYKPHDRDGFVFRSGSDEYVVDPVLDAGATISGRVLDEAGAPIEGADLVAGNPDSAGVAKSAADGSFTITGLTEHPANLSAAKAGYGKVVKRNLAGNPKGVEFRLPKAGTLIGRLMIDQVPKQVQIILTRYDEELKQVIPADSGFFSFTDAPTFAFANILPGKYWIEAQAEGYETAEKPEVFIDSGQITREVRIPMRRKN